MNSDFIELNRGFEAFRGDDSEEAIVKSYAIGRHAAWGWLSWKDLLSQQLAIVLGEPGSGKSEELEAQHRQQGGSFLIGLERLVKEPLTAVLSTIEMERFRRWTRGDGDALFLLDAVDESKLNHDDDFAYAIQRLSKEIGPALPRARFVITSRVSEWRPQTDLGLVMEHLLVEPPEMEVREGADRPRDARGVNIARSKVPKPSVVVAVLQPLTPVQVKQFVERRGAPDAAAFLDALQKGNVVAFAGRPLDVTHLYSYWREHKQLDSLTSIVDFMVTKLLAEVSAKERLDPLSPAAARQGAEYLAAAAILCKNLKFTVADDGQFPDEVKLSPDAVLPVSWTPELRRALMNRALFDSPSRGALSFHHRLHIEYLAARWVERLMDHNCGYDALQDLLFAEADGKTTLRTYLAPVAAWLITEGQESWRVRLAEVILQAAPEIHLQHGDPATLPLPYRRRVIGAIAGKYRERHHLGIHVSPDALSRLAAQELAPDINQYILSEEFPDELKSDLLMVVWEGKIVDCIPASLELFSRPSTSESLRDYCALAVRYAGSSAHQTELAKRATTTVGLSNTVIGQIFEALYPDYLAVSDAFEILQRAVDVGRYNHDLQRVVGRHLSDSLRPADTIPFLRGFLEMVRKPPLSEQTQVSKEYHWVASLIPVCLARALERSKMTATDREVALDAISLIDDWLLNGRMEKLDDIDCDDQVRQLLKPEHLIKQELFWRRFNALDKPIRFETFPFYKLNQYNGLAPLTVDDSKWLLEAIDGNVDPQARRAALVLLLQVHRENRVPKYRTLLSLGPAVANPDLRSIVLANLWGTISFPVMFRWQRYFKHKLQHRWWWRAQWRKVSNRYYFVRDRVWIYSHLREIRAAKHVRALAKLTEIMRSDGVSRFSASNWDAVQSKWGKRVAASVSEGCATAWRLFSPEFPHEQSNRASTDLRVVVGLIGLQTLWVRGDLNFPSLNEKDVERAVRYACGELNGLPEWFVELASTRAVEVEHALRLPVEAEFRYPHSLEHVHDVVAKLGSAPIVTAAVNSALLNALNNDDPKNARVLEQALAALRRGDDSTASALRRLAPTRVSRYDTGQHAWTLWMSTWLELDASTALSLLQAVVGGKAPQSADATMIELCSHISARPGRGAKATRSSFLEPRQLAILIPLVYAHVRPADDIDRTNGGVYSPVARDNAQDFRNSLWEALRSDESREADDVLIALLKDKMFEEQRDWIRSIIDGRQGRLADPAAWKASDIRQFSERFVHEPRSTYQLYKLIFRLLTNIKNDIERSENATNRAQVREGDLEKAFQGFLTRELDRQSLNWFSVTQESEVDLGQRPDLRVDGREGRVVPIEVKLANLRHWTIPKLLAGLETQLVEQYLRPEHIGFGIYVIATTSNSRQWELEDGRRIGFDELVLLLQRRAAEIASERSRRVDALAVIGINFADPRDATA
jgi:hypothetical protein